MSNIRIRELKIVELQKELASKYVNLMCSILLVYVIIFLFFMKDIFLVYYISTGIIFLFFTWKRIQNKYPIKKIASYYFLLAPLFSFYIILQFWELSVASYIWLVPIPFGAYIFFGRKEVLLYSLYSLFLILLAFIFAKTLTINFTKHSIENVRYTDTLLVISNIFVVALSAYYKDKIRELEILSLIEEKEKITLPLTLDEKDIKTAELLFEKIEKEMIEKKLFKNNALIISILSTTFNISNNYISKAIRYKGYDNFNSYINSHRIDYVKKLIAENDLEKVTLMYIYTEAGFTSQSTFNRAFKLSQGITPSEYIQNIHQEQARNNS